MARAKKTIAKKRLTYSPAERALLDLLPTNGERIDTKQLAAKRWPRDRPFYANSIVTTTLRNLIKKVERNGEDFQIVKGPRLGPTPISYHVEDRSRGA